MRMPKRLAVKRIRIVDQKKFEILIHHQKLIIRGVFNVNQSHFVTSFITVFLVGDFNFL